MTVRIGIVSAVDAAAGKIDVQSDGRVSVGLWLMDSVRMDTLEVGASVVCLYPSGSGEGVCLGRHYCQSYAPGAPLTVKQDVKIEGALQVTGDVTAANFP